MNERTVVADGASRVRRRTRRRTSAVGVIGELLVTVGIVVLLYVVWMLWLGDAIYGAQTNAQGEDLAGSWAQAHSVPTTTPAPDIPPTPDTTPAAAADAEPVITDPPSGTEDFAVMRIPRFGADYAVPIAGGVTRAGTLDRGRIGHYDGTQMPGETGNFAVAAHRTTYGAPFNRIAELRIGDAIVVETEAGWYTYRFRTLEYVQPTAVDVLLPVPQSPGVPSEGRYLTMTSCSPMYSMTERIIGYSVFESFTPRSDGAPASLTEGAEA